MFVCMKKEREMFAMNSIQLVCNYASSIRFMPFCHCLTPEQMEQFFFYFGKPLMGSLRAITIQ